MKKHILPALIMLCSTTLLAQKTEKEPYSVQKFPDAKVTHVTVETSGGNVVVMGSNTPGAIVEVYIEQNGGRRNRPTLSKEEIKQKLESEYEMNISYANNKLTATAKHKKTNDRDWWQDALNISFKLYVPEKVATELHTSGGNIALTNISGEQDFRTSGGNLTLEKLSGRIMGRTSGGNIKINNSKEDIDLATSGGNMVAENCSGKIRIGTSGGNVVMTELKGDIHASTSGGNVHGDHITGDLYAHTSGGSVVLKDLSGGLDAATSGGNIDASITDVTKNINITNSSGTIYLQLPKNKAMDLRLSASNIRTETLSNFKGSQDKERIDGSINGGGASVRVNASSGTIHLVWK
jgi:DUF4097 and DUF4098 domain-containing protein YvlB